ncbi:phosphoribosylamine--glycine ligase [Anderseniella sp. Alg231-50]|uniref:phosphoribosylamine--glycine ligase n=1 Tax=Anderseniella sp. Alg231-50 TaxID=1922226 RepID=UPI000D552701
MNILLIGSGGREHALAWAIANSPLTDTLFCSPGNAGIAREAEIVALDLDDAAAIVNFCKVNAIGLVVVGPEAPLVAGLADRLRDAGITTFGPGAAAARLEGSKGFTKDICAKYNIPTGAYGRFGNETDALSYLAEHDAPIVVKADGLAAGKGVTVAMTMSDAEAAVREIFAGRFGAAGAEVVIEEYLVGEEASFFAICDGTTAVAFGSAQDHKCVGEGDTGPNTGGMGAYSPAPVMDETVSRRTMDEIIKPTLAAMAAEGAAFQGVLFAGLMITDTGPQLIEYNVRFGDPECQVLMMRLKDDIVTIMLAACSGTLDKVSVRWHDTTALTVVMATQGYPGDVEKGSVIGNLDAASAMDGVQVFHAGTKRDGDDIMANGGRVLNITAEADSVGNAQKLAYAAVDTVDWPQGFCRRDIGWRAVEREKGSA